MSHGESNSEFIDLLWWLALTFHRAGHIRRRNFVARLTHLSGNHITVIRNLPK